MEALALQDEFDQNVGEAVLRVEAAFDGHSGFPIVRDIGRFVGQVGMNAPLEPFHGSLEGEGEVEECKIAEPGRVDLAGTSEHLERWHEGVQAEDALVGKEEAAQAVFVGMEALVPLEDIAHTANHNFLDHTSQDSRTCNTVSSRVLPYPRINPSHH